MKTIYLIHSTSFDYKKELYTPIKESELFTEYKIILPHETKKVKKSKDLIKNKTNLIIAELSYPSTGVGIELGWADSYNIKIIGLIKKGKISNSAKFLTKNIIEYKNDKELITKLKHTIKKCLN